MNPAVMVALSHALNLLATPVLTFGGIERDDL